MRVALVVAMATLTLGLASGSMLAQTSEKSPALRSIDMLDTQTGWAITLLDGALLRTINGGTQWTDVTPVSPSGQKVRVWRITVLSPLIAWIMPSGPFGSKTTEIFRTTDGGRTWRSAAIQSPSVTSISFINPREGWLVAVRAVYTGHQDVDIYRSTDGGTTWIKVASAALGNESSGLPTTGGKDAITFLDSTTGWITGSFDWTIFYVTRDGGHLWRRQDLPRPPELTRTWWVSLRPPKFFTAQERILFAFYALHDDTGMAVFYVSHAGGRTWTYTTPVPMKDADDRKPNSVADMNHLWAKDGGVLHKTSDGGRRWTAISPGSVFTDVTQLDFISSEVGWAVRNTSPHGGGPRTFPFLLKTLDGGRTWTPITYTTF